MVLFRILHSFEFLGFFVPRLILLGFVAFAPLTWCGQIADHQFDASRNQSTTKVMATQTFYPQSSANQPSSSGLMALQGCVSSLNASLSTVQPFSVCPDPSARKQSRDPRHGNLRLSTHAKAPRCEPRAAPSFCVVLIASILN